jgi:large conductance mechanosensitive channel
MKKLKKNKKVKLPDEVIQARKKASKVAGEFREFISRGNVTDMAVGIIVGTAFTAIVNSLVQDIITPAMGLLIGGIDFTNLQATINSPIFKSFSVTIAYGKFMQAVISFFIIAVCVFFLVKVLNAVRRKNEKPPEPPKADPMLVLLTEIRDLLADPGKIEHEGEQLTFDSVSVIEDSDPSKTQSSDSPKS